MDSTRKKSKIEKEYGSGNVGQRHVQIILVFLAGIIAYGMRAVLSVGIVAMTSEHPPDSSIPTYPEWTNQGTMLSSFFWGYIILQVVAGQIAEKFGPKYFLALAITIASVFTSLIPIMAEKFGSTGVIVNRVIQGLSQGFLLPSTHYIISKWTPLKERSRVASFVYFAGQLGTAIAMVITGAISETKFGWPYIFYMYGVVGLTWVVFYAWLGSNSPSEQKSISIEERKYIEQTTEVRIGNETYPEWTNQGTMLSSFFWGYIILQVFAGQIAQKFGPKYFLASAITIASVFTSLIPIMAENFGSTGVIVNRVIQGLSQGFLFPSTHYVLSKWTPLKERSRIASFVYFAGQLGTAIAMIVTGAISDTKFGWPYVFYLYGVVGLTWVVFYVWLGSNSPAEQKSISFEEKKYIEQTTEVRIGNEVPSKTPWKAIFTSLPFWAIIVSHAGNSWGFWTLLTEIPTFMSSVLNYDIKNDSILSALPYFVYSIFGIIIGPLSDTIFTRNILTLGRSRKLFNSFGFLFPALFLIVLCFAPRDNNFLHVLLLVLAVSTNSGILAGYNVNHIDLAPNFAGTLMGITNCMSTVGSIIAPLLVQFIVTDEKDESLWNIVFFITAGIYTFSAVFFLIFGSGDMQPWNFPIDYKRTGQLGTAIGMVLTGAISETKFGWPYVFYLYGVSGIRWAVLYIWLGCNSPAEHKSISFEEKKYIEQITEIRIGDEVPSKTPWKAIFSSVPFWAIIVSHFGNSFWTPLTEIPSFMSSILNYDIEKVVRDKGRVYNDRSKIS